MWFISAKLRVESMQLVHAITGYRLQMASQQTIVNGKATGLHTPRLQANKLHRHQHSGNVVLVQGFDLVLQGRPVVFVPFLSHVRQARVQGTAAARTSTTFPATRAHTQDAAPSTAQLSRWWYTLANHTHVVHTMSSSSVSKSKSSTKEPSPLPSAGVATAAAIAAPICASINAAHTTVATSVARWPSTAMLCLGPTRGPRAPCSAPFPRARARL